MPSGVQKVPVPCVLPPKGGLTAHRKLHTQATRSINCESCARHSNVCRGPVRVTARPFVEPLKVSVPCVLHSNLARRSVPCVPITEPLCVPLHPHVPPQRVSRPSKRTQQSCKCAPALLLMLNWPPDCFSAGFQSDAPRTTHFPRESLPWCQIEVDKNFIEGN